MSAVDEQARRLSGLADRRIVIAATGALGTAFLPSWIGWMQEVCPSTRFRVVLTPRARAFVGVSATTALTGERPLIDEWGDRHDDPVHVGLEQWAEGYLVHPASMDFLSRLSLGLCDSPLLLALQGTVRPLVVAAAAPPGFTSGPSWPLYTERMSARARTVLLPPMDGVSVAAPERVGAPPQLFPVAAAALGELLLQEAA
ncbi:flavoprotein [Rathayibacter tanaceti]|uniref:Cypemycin decarboxylase n=2 Tax=Rathayibacter tanaceti TaxID=1671680 RepID=A0A166HYL9_9MICO|nr:flavoprotein [Rathayibacter tanaceti]KZX21354.1 Cypemycin decarboxylase [Rathayibacter tanaceti]QHC54393.1 phosphopantothenoylcysteine decarboxylase [Rathayibacter tanaceti]TCO38077.1 flavoprotein [Rathayibacter tanaceti]